MLDDRHADLARKREHIGVEAGGQREREQLVLGAEVGPLQPLDVLRILRARLRCRGIGVDRADAGFLKRANQASLCSGVWQNCEMSTIAVVPISIMPSAVSSTPA